VKVTNHRTGIVFTITLLILIGLAVEGDAGADFTLTMLASTVGSFAFFAVLFPGSLFFSLALANSLAIYVSIFVFFSEANFAGVSDAAQDIGFALPLAAFLAGTFLWRDTIRDVVQAAHVASRAEFRRVTRWLVPVALIGALTFLRPEFGIDRLSTDAAFLLAMTSIALVVFAAARDVAVFLIDAGLLLEEFFERMERLVLPVYAFLTFYSLIVVGFAAIYKLIDVHMKGPHFRILNEDRAIGYSEALYFSIVTLSTVGYGDVAPVSDAVRVVASIEVVFGVTLLLVGLSEIMSYNRDLHARRFGRKDGEDV
jgi:voltage-gated potassium channel